MRIVILVLIFFLYSISCFGQSGSFIQSKYTAYGYWNEILFPGPSNGKQYVYPSADTVANEWNQRMLSVFKYSPLNYFPAVSDSIQITQSFTLADSLNNTANYYYNINPGYAYKQLNPVKSYSFSLQGIRDTAYTLFTPKTGSASASDTEICFFIIPGSGDNQAIQIIRNDGYHVTNCNVVSTLKKHGDVYIFVKPNEEFRAIRINTLPERKMTTDGYPTESYMNQYLISNYRHEGINYLIESLAAIKELKRKYKKVFLLGCSQGGYSGLYASLQSEVDGVLISSGYSVKLDDNYLQFGNMAQKFAQLPFLLLKDSIKKKISEQKTSYFFSWPTQDSPIYQDENMYHYTESYFSSTPALSKVKYLYTYNNHAFPPCVYIDSFVKEVKYKPKAFLSDTLNACYYDSLIRKLTFTGHPPFSFQVFRNDSLLASYLSTTKDTLLSFTLNGKYQIKNIVDANGLNGIWSDPFLYHQRPHMHLHLLSKNYRCDSLNTQVRFSFEGTPPFTFTVSKKDNAGIYQPIQNDVTEQDSLNVVLPNGDYKFSVHDSIACELAEDSISISETPVQAQYLGLNYDCSSHLTQFHFNLAGKTPFTFNYQNNGSTLSHTESQNNVHWSVPNGDYYLMNVTDANNCLYPLQLLLQPEYDSLNIQINSPVYDCSSNTSAVALTLNGNSPFTIAYLLNSTPQNFLIYHDTLLSYQQGTIQYVSVTDSTGCSKTLVQPTWNFNSDTLEVTMTNPIYQCDSNKTKIHFEFEGNPPYTLYYLKNSQAKQHTTSNPSLDLYFENGLYFFNEVEDSTGCTSPLLQTYTFDSPPISAQILQESYQCDSNAFEISVALGGTPPWQLEYKKGASTFITSSLNPSMNLFLGNGNWTINKVTDLNGCTQTLNQSYNLSYDTISASVVNQVYDCDSNLMKVSMQLTGNAPWDIHYIENNAGSNSHYLHTYDPSPDIYLPNGMYTFLEVSDSTGCSTPPLMQFIENHEQALSITPLLKEFDCDSLKLRCDYLFTGNSPYTITYKNMNSGMIYQTTSTDSFFHLYLLPGDYTMLQGADLHCNLVMNDTIHFSYEALSSFVTPEKVNCDSSKYEISIITQHGRKPYRYIYYEQSIPKYFYTSQDTTTLILDNGSYFLEKVQDSLGCSVSYNKNLTLNYHRFHYKGYSRRYLCDKDSTEIIFDVNHDQAVWLTYTKNGGTHDSILIDQNSKFIWGNGDYYLVNIHDAEACLDTLSTPITIDDEPVEMSSLLITTDCTNKLYQYEVELQGKAPWQCIYNHQNKPDTITFAQSSFQWQVSPGDYYFVQLTDANQCSTPLNQNAHLVDFLYAEPRLVINRGVFTATAGGVYYNWYRDNTLIDSTTTPTYPAQGDGNYEVVIKDAAGCAYKSNKISLTFGSDIILFPNPTNDKATILLNDDFGLSWSYLLYDSKGNKLGSGEDNSHYHVLNVEALTSGIYSLIITYELDNSRHIFRLVKE